MSTKQQIWLLQKQSQLTSPLAVASWRNYANRALHLSVSDHLKVNHYVKKEEYLRDLWYPVLSKTSSASVESTSRSNHVTQYIFPTLRDQYILHSSSLYASINDGRISIMTATIVSVWFQQWNPFLSCLFTRQQLHSSCSARRAQDISFSTSKFTFHIYFFLLLTSSWMACYWA